MALTGAERWPVAADFRPPPGNAERHRWAEADREARPGRLARLRQRMDREGIDGYYGVRPEHSRYLTGFALGDGEEKVAGTSGQFLVGMAEVVLFADSRYAVQAARKAPEARLEAVYGDLPDRWPSLVASIGVRRVGFEAGFVSQASWSRLAAAAPDVELVPVEGWLEEDRAVKEPAEVARIGAACAVADRALVSMLPEIRAGRTERDLALDLEWAIRTGGADGLAFDIACLSGPEAALPHGEPQDRPIRAGEVLLFDFGAQVDGYRSDMTRTLFVGAPTERDLGLYELVASAQAAALDRLEAVLEVGGTISGWEVDETARAVIEAAGHGERFGHGTGHGIGLATHELPNLGKRAPTTPLPSPTVFSVEPGVYLAGEMGVRIEDLVVYDMAARRLTRLTQFPREVVVVDG
jgi:Xaa-Pro aminopeptidase